MLIEAETFYTLLRNGNIQLGAGLPTLRNSILGWIISGPIYPAKQGRELEEPSPSKSLINDNDYCEYHFNRTAGYPEVSQAISQDFYVDNFLSGGNSIEVMNKLCLEVSALLQAAGFKLRNWTSNEPIALNGLDTNSISEHVLLSACAQTVQNPSSKAVKRPLNIEWDHDLPEDIIAQWNKFRNELSQLHTIQIPRMVIEKQSVNIQLHGFSDSSKDAYGACIYIRCINASGEITISLLIAKSRVAPLQPLTIPRLELSAALLLAKLYERVTPSLNMTFDSTQLWCDSTVALCWIKTTHNLQTFVANRVQQIQELTKPHFWHYVQMAQNPADLLTRGLYPP
ncbi:hypothetical protein NQ315_014649 [Exocentrus adspersus]|uniref:Uncharacterized protein n=1 Tax=Exocentrus adspersus TaxID=1586481 RepID=A0AAV8VRR8_9CUCU|nr:hypothetical protein NQ315_014649 [Exocentrus adspersus]